MKGPAYRRKRDRILKERESFLREVSVDRAKRFLYLQGRGYLLPSTEKWSEILHLVRLEVECDISIDDKIFSGSFLAARGMSGLFSEPPCLSKEEHQVAMTIMFPPDIFDDVEDDDYSI